MAAANVEPAPIEGACDPRFAAVGDAFADNFARRGEVGGGVAVAVGGRVVVDLWGGWVDPHTRRPWRRDTLVNFFSVGKALTALCALRLVERGRLDLDTPMARLWPEFGRDGKERITLRQVLSHRAGLPAVGEPLADGVMLDWAAMTRALERQRPWWPPGEAHGYHVNTFGYLAGELVRRASGSTLGRLLREEIAGPLDADVHIGLPAAAQARVADFLWPVSAVAPVAPDTLGEDDRMRWCTYWNPPGLSGAGWVNTAAWRAAEIPSTNGHGTARGIARVYAALAAGGEIEGVRVIAEDVLRTAVEEHSSGEDRVTQRPSRFGLGFQLTQPERPLGPSPRAFGHFGAGGALGFCDPDAGVAFGYVMNEMGPRWQNPRNRALIDAVYASLP